MSRPSPHGGGRTTSVVATVLGAVLAVGGIVPAAHAADPIPGLDGTGSARDPYQIGTGDDLRAAAAALNDDPGAYGGAAYRLVADIDLGGAEFGGINSFRGTLEGAGHTISDVTLVPEPTAGGEADRLGLIRQLDGGVVQNLTLDGVRADGGERGGFIGAVAVIATDATISGVSVVGADLSAPAAEKVGGVVAELRGGSVSGSWVSGTLTAGEMPAGIAAYANQGATVRHNLVEADLAMTVPGGDAGTKGNDAGMVVGYPGSPNSGEYAGNVALGGSIEYSGKVDGFVGRVVGYTAYDGWTARDNLANAAITVAGETVAGPGTRNQHGTDATAAELAQQATYEKLGWDFVSAWTFDDERGHPVPAYTPSLFGHGTADRPYEIGTPDDLEHLAAQLNAGSTRYAGGKHFVLTADLDMAGREAFVGIDRFDGVLDGAGHTVAGLVYAPNPDAGDDADHLGLVRRLDGGTVENLTLTDLTADGGDRDGLVAGIAVVATDATLVGNSVVDATLTATRGEKAAGLVAELRGGTVADSWVRADVSAAKMPAGLVAYANETAVVRHNLVEGDLTVAADGGADGTRGVDAAHVVAYPGNPSTSSSFAGNVVRGGSIAYSGKVDGFAGRVVGYTGYEGWTAIDNLADAAITVGGETVAGPGTRNQHGTDATAERLAQRATYEGLGWDFAGAWEFDDEAGHPVPKYVSSAEAPNRITTTFHGDPATRRAFTWYSELETGSATVVLSTDRDFPEGAATVEVAAKAEQSEDGETFYRAVAGDLEPGSRYYYRLGDASEQVWSATGTFETAGDDGDFTFVDLTDTQSQDLGEAELSAQTMSKALATVPDAAFMMHNGDVVEHGDKEQDWKDLLDSARPSLTSTTLAPAAGNHDAATNAFADHFTLEAPNEQDTSTGAYYSYTYQGTHFMVLNTNEGGADGVSADQLAWLRADAEQARADGARWLVLSMHKGVYTTANHLDDTDVKAMRKTLVPLIDELDIDLVLQGHDHVMSRSKVLVADPDGTAGARPVETTTITEVRGGKRIEYAVDPGGTIYYLPNTAGAKHYRQATDPDGVDLEKYLSLFDRTGEQDTENFTAVNVTADRLTVEVYDVRDQGVPRLFEGFGIDRGTTPVDDRITALPAAGDVTLDDAATVAEVRAAVDGLTSAQRGALTGLAKLEAVELRLRELRGLVSTDGATVAWADADATSRQTMTVRNDTRSDFDDTPVRLRVADTPDVGPEELALFGPDGAPLPHEVETWQPGGTSSVWVRVPHLPARSATTVWAYYGGGAAAGDPAAVWSEDYALVEHFGRDEAGGERRADSTGRATGVVVGEDLEGTVSDRGTGQTRFESSRLEYGGDVGGDLDRIAVSGVYSVTADDVAAADGDATVVAKQSATGDGHAAFWQGVRADADRLGTRIAGNSFEFDPVDLKHDFALPADGEPHLVTQTYDGMTYSVFVDGEEVHSQFLEYRTTYGDPALPTTIGDVATDDGSIASPFRGTIDEVQVAGVAFTPDFEAFRYAMLLGDAVTPGERVDKADEPVTLVVGTPRPGATLDAGLVDVTGTVSERSALAAEVAGEEVFSAEVAAGEFAVRVPVDAPGEQAVTFTATATDGGGASSAEVDVTVEDAVAPAEPELADDAAAASSGDPVTLTATPRTESREAVDVSFRAGPTIPLDDQNVVVRAGTTTDRVPDALTPTSGTVTDEPTPTTVGENENPFQLYEISLTAEQADQEEHHLVWRGTGDTRQVSAYVYDHEAGSWVRKDTGSDTAGGTVTLDVTARADEHAVSGGTLHLLVWRGLTELPTGDDHDYESLPPGATYDWGLDHVPDTQLYAQATPAMMNEQFRYVADVADERKTELVVQSGDWVNREYLSQEYQWKGVEPAARALEDADLPFMVSWGNHDYSDARNGRVMLPRYFPMSRFEASLEGSPWTFGGSDSIDNYYYTGEVAGAKLLVLTVGFFSADQADDAGLAWAQDVIESHPDHAVIIANHNSVNAGVNAWSNANVTSRLIDPYPNVKLVLGGHISATGVASRKADDGHTVYGILTDYQGRVYGGQEYLKHLSVDAENDLLHVNTYSPLLDTATSDGPYRQQVPDGAIPGFHGSDSENFVLDLDLGGSTTRTLATESLTLGAGERAQVGGVQRAVGAEPVTATLDGVQAGTGYEWFVELRDAAGNVTRSAPRTFVTAEAGAPSAPRDVAATVDGADVVVTWAAPADDGGAAVEEYEVTLSDGTAKSVAGDAGTLTFADREPGTYTATVRARNAAGWSAPSAPSEPVVVEAPAPQPPAWEAGQVYLVDERVTYSGAVWEASWWTRGQTPGDPYGPWQEIATAPDGTDLWTPSRIFDSGDVVVHDGRRYEAQWWTRNQAPGDPYGPWRATR
ncbi:DUF2341 domain-containing protein [Isoptericola cucumis]|uniref:Fibronectin type-III domain-containing protein n=2 Tax=Isoptericola cucumis TaxID=1776856 RepID=A0ABQ2B6E5_9MICO|nr:DUF2341 domain-containing protein [Isoptericola cucumis]GGI09160.1 hypothetical protein GCM10007368_24780 [Isoptericola cucumis]